MGNDKSRGKHVFQFTAHKNADRAPKGSSPILEPDQYTLDVAKTSHETWLSDIQRPALHNNFGFDSAGMEAAAKKPEAMEIYILTDEERSQTVLTITKAIETDKYHNTERTNARNNILKIWNYLSKVRRPP